MDFTWLGRQICIGWSQNRPHNGPQDLITVFLCVQIAIDKMQLCSLTPAHTVTPPPPLDNYKYLGVWLDCKLSFQTHIKHLQYKVKSRIGFLFRNKASFTHAAKHTLVKLTILSILDFGDVIYKIASNLYYSLYPIQQIGFSLSQCHPFCHQSPIYYPPLRPVCSRWLALASYSSPNPLAPGYL